MKMVSMNAYSKDLRLKVLSAIDRGIPRKEVSDLFGVSLSTIKRWLKRRRQRGDVDIYKIPGRPSVKGKALRQWLPSQPKNRGKNLTPIASMSLYGMGESMCVEGATDAAAFEVSTWSISWLLRFVRDKLW
jgi:hypothetical protein